MFILNLKFYDYIFYYSCIFYLYCYFILHKCGKIIYHEIYKIKCIK